MAAWHFITGEFLPTVGGTTSYVLEMGRALIAAGHEVHVWCPGAPGDARGGDDTPVSGLVVHRELGAFGPGDLRRAGAALDRFPGPRRLFVQWVPQRFGLRSMNLPFCLWLLGRAARHGDVVELMVHQPFLYFGDGWRRDAVALVHRAMMAALLQAAARVWLSTEIWAPAMRPVALGRRIEMRWLPVPNSVPVVADPAGAAALRRRLAGDATAPDDARVVAHFSTFGTQFTPQLRATLPPLLAGAPRVRALLIGAGSVEARQAVVADADPSLAARVHATGAVSYEDVSRALAASDLALQPYPDGVGSHRSSVLAAMAHGLAVVTTGGRFTDPWWRTAGAVEIVPVGDDAGLVAVARRLLADDVARGRLARAGRAAYDARFDVRHAVKMLTAE